MKLGIVATILLIALSPLVVNASPQMYPSNVTYMGKGELSTKVTLVNSDQRNVVEVVYVKDLTQRETKDVVIHKYNMLPNQDVNIPVRLNISTPKKFWICARTFDQGFPLRNCTTFKPRGL
jgi:hypothetical protein